MSAIWPNVTHFRLWKVTLIKTRWTRLYICSRLVTYGIRRVNGKAFWLLSIY